MTFGTPACSPYSPSTLDDDEIDDLMIIDGVIYKPFNEGAQHVNKIRRRMDSQFISEDQRKGVSSFVGSNAELDN